MQLPSDPIMLMSVINMQLRDRYSNLNELCDDMNLNKSELLTKLKNVGFEYDEENRKFW